VCIDLTSEHGVDGAFERVRIAYGTHIAWVIHLAAYYDLTGEPSPLYEEITVGGTERLLKHLKDFSVGQFVFTSTMLVHAGAKPGQRINEEWPLDPKLPWKASHDWPKHVQGNPLGPLKNYSVQRDTGGSESFFLSSMNRAFLPKQPPIPPLSKSTTRFGRNGRAPR
jgi:3-beta hydroxysteroid dehydrogenase/isomerase family